MNLSNRDLLHPSNLLPLSPGAPETSGDPGPEESGEHAVKSATHGGCAQAASKRGIHGLSPCCDRCHGIDGLQSVYIDNELTTLCCTAITEIMLRWPSVLRYTDTQRP